MNKELDRTGTNFRLFDLGSQKQCGQIPFADLDALRTLAGTLAVKFHQAEAMQQAIGVYSKKQCLGLIIFLLANNYNEPIKGANEPF